MQNNIKSLQCDDEQRRLYTSIFTNALRNDYESALIKDGVVYLTIGTNIFQCNETWLAEFFAKNQEIRRHLLKKDSTEEIKLFYENEKSKDTMLYDRIQFQIFRPGVLLPENYEVYVYPLYPRAHTPFVCIVKQGEIKPLVEYIGEGEVYRDIHIGDCVFQLTILWNKHTFCAEFILSDTYKKIGYKINQKVEKHRCFEVFRTGYGHVCVNKNSTEYHILPFMENNGRAGLCKFICVCVKMKNMENDKIKLYDVFNENGPTQIKKLSIIPYWTDKYFCIQYDDITVKKEEGGTV